MSETPDPPPLQPPASAPRRRRSAAPGVAALAPAWITIACAMPGPTTPPDALNTVDAFTYAAALAQSPTSPTAPTALTAAQPPITIAAFAAGDPDHRPVIYVHGTPGDATGWRDYLVEPVPGTRSIAIDRPGFGRSTKDRAFPALADQSAAIAPLLNADRPAILVGHSLGGPIVADVAARYPDRVAGVVIVAGSLDPGLEKILFIQRIGAFPPISAALPRWLRHTNHELLPLEAELRELEPRLADITAPIEIIHGTKDAQVPYANVSYMLTRFPNAASVRMTELIGVNHFLPWNSATHVRAAITRLHERTERTPTAEHAESLGPPLN